MRVYIDPLYEKKDTVSTLFLDITFGTIADLGYLNFRIIIPGSAIIMLDRFKIMKINVKIDSYKWHIIMTFDFTYGAKDNSSDSSELRYLS